MENIIKKEDIIDYGYYEDPNHYVIVLNREKLKEIFKADKIIFEETY